MPVLAYCLRSKIGNSKNANKWRVQGQMAICNWTQVSFLLLEKSCLNYYTSKSSKLGKCRWDV